MQLETKYLLLCLFVGLFASYRCEAGGKEANGEAATTISPEAIATVTVPVPDDNNTTTSTPQTTTVTPPPTTSTTKPTTTTPDSTTKSQNTTTTTTTTSTTTTTTTTTVAPTTTSTTQSPSTTTTAKPTPVPCGHFDGSSFIGGIVLTLGLLAIGLIAYKFYNAHYERNYHTL